MNACMSAITCDLRKNFHKIFRLIFLYKLFLLIFLYISINFVKEPSDQLSYWSSHLSFFKEIGMWTNCENDHWKENDIQTRYVMLCMSLTQSSAYIMWNRVWSRPVLLHSFILNNKVEIIIIWRTSSIISVFERHFSANFSSLLCADNVSFHIVWLYIHVCSQSIINVPFFLFSSPKISPYYFKHAL